MNSLAPRLSNLHFFPRKSQNVSWIGFCNIVVKYIEGETCNFKPLWFWVEKLDDSQTVYKFCLKYKTASWSCVHAFIIARFKNAWSNFYMGWWRSNGENHLLFFFHIWMICTVNTPLIVVHVHICIFYCVTFFFSQTPNKIFLMPLCKLFFAFLWSMQFQ